MAAHSMERGDSDSYQVNERAFFFDLRGTAPATTTCQRWPRPILAPAWQWDLASPLAIEPAADWPLMWAL